MYFIIIIIIIIYFIIVVIIIIIIICRMTFWSRYDAVAQPRGNTDHWTKLKQRVIPLLLPQKFSVLTTGTDRSGQKVHSDHGLHCLPFHRNRSDALLNGKTKMLNFFTIKDYFRCFRNFTAAQKNCLAAVFSICMASKYSERSL